MYCLHFQRLRGLRTSRYSRIDVAVVLERDGSGYDVLLE
jgi:hypothetical protein